MKLLRMIQSLLGLDRSVALAGSGRALAVILGPVGSLIVVWTLTVDEQGLYYLFLSLTSLRSFFDLGASAAIAQMAPHMRPAPGEVEGGLAAPDFIRVAGKWMKTVALLFGVVCGFIGLAYLQWTGQMTGWVAFAWLLTVAATAVSGSLEGAVQIVYGSGNVDSVSRLRISSQLLQYFIQWALLFSGLSLLSFGISMICVFFWQRFSLRRSFPDLWIRSPVVPARSRLIRAEMGSLVKKASVTYVSGYLVFQIQQPIVFKMLGADSSAKLGLTSMVGSSLIGLASIWSLAKFPRFAKQVADEDYESAFGSFRRNWFRTAAVAAIAFVTAFGALEVLHCLPRFSERLMSLGEALPLFLALLVQQLALALTFWPRSFKIEPFAPIAVIQMLLTPLATWLGVLWFGLFGIGLANLASWLVGLAGISWIYGRYLPGRRGFLQARELLGK
jgi:hypothetical protein